MSEPAPMTSRIDTSVLIVGAGPVGLVLACELGRLGIDCTLIEKRDGSINVPKMSVVSSRALEFCRRWGLERRVREAVWSESHALDFVYVTNLRGRELARVKIPSYKDRKLTFTPEGPCHCPQIYFDPILTAHAKTLPQVTLRYGERLDSFVDSGDHVVATVASVDTGASRDIRAKYLVACDGAASVARQALGIELEGLGVVANSVNIYFQSAELPSLHDKGWARIYRVVDESGCWAELIPIDGVELWRLSVFDDPRGGAEPDATLERMLGGKFPYRILDVSPWERRDFVANSFGRGRVWLAGDAVHQCSPTGGFGMHMGIEDAMNIVWKIKAMLQGWGGERLLESYSFERRQTDQRDVAISTRNYHQIAAIPGWDDVRARAENIDPANEWRDHLAALSGTEVDKLQYCYERSPVCVDDGAPAIEVDPKRFQPSTRPGTRAPHVWLAEGKSILDLFGDGFVLLRFAGATGSAGLELAARQRNVPLRAIDIDNAEAAAQYERRFVLVRPDGHVAWRGDECPADGLALIDRVRGAP